MKENIQAPRHWPLRGQMASNAENVSIWRRHDEVDHSWMPQDPIGARSDAGSDDVFC